MRAGTRAPKSPPAERRDRPPVRRSGLSTAARLFDGAAAGYDDDMRRGLGRFGKDIGYYAEYKARLLREQFPGPVPSILEFGCGVGRNLPHLRRLFPESRLSGCDVSRASLDLARIRCPDASFFECGRRPGPEGPFDLILIAGVLHHITTDEERRAAFEQVRGSLRRGGRVAIFEHNPRNPVVTASLRRISWDDDADLLRMEAACVLLERCGFRVLEKRYVLFVPPLLKRLAFLDSRLSRCPLGAQYFIEAGT
jgi:SAM-dependent methyltransferase